MLSECFRALELGGEGGVGLSEDRGKGVGDGVLQGPQPLVGRPLAQGEGDAQGQLLPLPANHKQDLETCSKKGALSLE